MRYDYCSHVIEEILTTNNDVPVYIVISMPDHDVLVIVAEDTPPPPPEPEEPEARADSPQEEPPSYNDVQREEEEAEPEPETHAEAVVASADIPAHDYHPRLCVIRKWPDFQGYGFNLHAEKDKKGQYIGLVDADSPAEDAGLRKGDRIIEVNGDNIEDSSHTQVIQKIKAGGEETALLVVDTDADEFYKNNGITITSDMPEVIKGETTPRQGAPGMDCY